MRKTPLLLALACLSLLVPPVASNHMQSEGGRIIVFDHKTGNEWWVEVVLGGQDAGSVSSVMARDDEGSWVVLTKRSWGAWAASFHIEPGHRVQFHAEWAGGAMTDSCWFTHPQGVEECQAQVFDATFSNVRGNAWWIQTDVTSPTGHLVRSVEVRLDDGSFRPLQKQSWGPFAWAASFNMPEGTKVQLRATESSGSSDLSVCYRWVPAKDQNAPETPCSPPPGFDATFTNVKGNEWWVEVKVTANKPIAGVDARVGCAENGWNPLTLRSWGAWAASFRVQPGMHVDFRARSTTGATDLSNAYIWPEAAKTDRCDAQWPREGSFADVRFRSQQTWDDLDGSHLVLTDGLVHSEYHGGFWDGTCQVVTKHRDGSGKWTNKTETFEWDRAPPMGEANFVGGKADVEVVENCALVLYPDQVIRERTTRTFSIRSQSGDPVPIEAYHAHTQDTTFTWDFWWDVRHGLVLSFDIDNPPFGTSSSYHAEGWLLNTDATFDPFL